MNELRHVQGNILKPHARRFALHALLRFTSAQPAQAWIAGMADHVTTAADEFTVRQTAPDARRGPIPDPKPTFVSLALSARGLPAPNDRASSWGEAEAVFRQSMAGRRTVLSDPPRREWESPYREGCDALLIIADHDAGTAWSRFGALFSKRPVEGVAVVGVEVGQRMTNEYGQDIEHFGYVDGTSQPLFFCSDVNQADARNRRHDWSPGFAPRQVLVRGRRGGYGSYLVFRKLEQDLAAFAVARQRLAAQLGVLGDSALAGATIVGRYEDGRPAGLRDQLPSVLPVENGFVYNQDPPACPIGSHVRIVNPRAARYRATMIARRGMPYGPPTDHAAWTSPASLPSAGVGLLFMAYMADIGAQYEAIQIAANGSGSGQRDPLIGQRAGRTGTYGGFATDADLVRLKGGEYFFVPSPADLGAMDVGSAGAQADPRPASSRAPATSYEASL
jgi:Dyp-type peroxidase family